MGKDTKGKIQKTNKFVQTVESWWALGEALWEARFLLGVVGTIIIAIGTAVMLALINIYSMGWPYWVLLSFPVFMGSALFLLGVSWVWHLRPPSMRRNSSKRKTPSNDKAKPKYVTVDKSALPLTPAEKLIQICSLFLAEMNDVEFYQHEFKIEYTSYLSKTKIFHNKLTKLGFTLPGFDAADNLADWILGLKSLIGGVLPYLKDDDIESAQEFSADITQIMNKSPEAD